MFPRQRGCPKCMFDEQEDVALARRGTLWTWTVQAFPPKAPPYLGPVGDEPRVLQHLQVLGHGGAGHAHAVGDVADGSCPTTKPQQDRAARGVAEGVEDALCVSHH